MALSADVNTYALTYAIEEAPLGEEDQNQSYATDAGHVYGEDNPTGSARRTFQFTMLSAAEPLFPSTPDGDDPSLRVLLGKFYAGGEMRVWRAFGADFDPFDPETNTDGYTDMVTLETTEAGFSWEDNVMTRFTFVLEGVEA